MNIQTLLNLRKNPHYKFTRAQQDLLNEHDRTHVHRPHTHVVEFGAPPIHNATVPTNEKGLPKRKRTSK